MGVAEFVGILWLQIIRCGSTLGNVATMKRCVGYLFEKTELRLLTIYIGCGAHVCREDDMNVIDSPNSCISLRTQFSNLRAERSIPAFVLSRITLDSKIVKINLICILKWHNTSKVH